MILLIQPKAGNLEKIGIRMPLGLLYLATYLKKNNISSKIIDTRITNDWKKDIINSLEETEFVGITCMVGPQIKNAIKISRFIKKKKPKAKIVLGGIHPTILTNKALEEGSIDIVVRGDGEKQLVELAKKKDIAKIKGISYKKRSGLKEAIINNAPQEPLKPEEMVVPDYSFINMDKYSSMTYSGEKGLCIQTSRGCPYNCGFCHNCNKQYKRWVPFPIGIVIKNIDVLVKKYGAKTIYFIDDNIAADQKRFIKILRKIKQKSYKINLAFQGIRIDSLERFTKKTYVLMKESGVRSLDIGIETFDKYFLKKIDKKLTKNQILKTLKMIKEEEFNLKLNLISGLPGQTKKNIDYDIDEAKKIEKEHKNSYVLFNIYMPFPGTTLYKDAIKAGFKAPKSFREWGEFTGTTWMKKHSWFGKKTRKRLEAMNFLFLFNDKNILTKVNKKITRVIFKLYSPIARFRLKHKLYFFMIEKKFAELFN